MPHKLGQVFLKDLNMKDKILREAAILPEDQVLEIGCGEGVLSISLAKLAEKLSIIELDKTWMEVTKQALKNADNVTYLLGDILKVGIPDNDKPWRIVANIPYYISAKILKLLIPNRHKFTDAWLMVQDEFALKCIASPGTPLYTSLTVYLSYYFDIQRAFKVPKSCFRPIPKVDSAMIHIKPKAQLPFQLENPDDFFNIVRSCFWGRRKTVSACLAKSPYVSLTKNQLGCSFLKEKGHYRGETFSLDDFYTCYKQLYGLF